MANDVEVLRALVSATSPRSFSWLREQTGLHERDVLDAVNTLQRRGWVVTEDVTAWHGSRLPALFIALHPDHEAHVRTLLGGPREQCS